jgi:hypothetical protein
MYVAGVPFSTLAGDRQRYGRFGWELAGRRRCYRVTDRSLVDPPAGDEHVTRYDGSDADVEFVRDLYETRRYRVGRDLADYRTRLGRRHVTTLLYTEPGSEAYLSFTRGDGTSRTMDIAGTPEGIHALIGHAVRAFGLSELRVSLHPADPLNATLADPTVSIRWQEDPNRVVNVRDLPGVLNAFERQLERRAGVDSRPGDANESTPNVPTDGSVTIGVAGDSDAAELVWSDDAVSVRRVETEPAIELPRQSVTRLCFDRSETVADYDGHPFLDQVFPLAFHTPRLDQV